MSALLKGVVLGLRCVGEVSKTLAGASDLLLPSQSVIDVEVVNVKSRKRSERTRIEEGKEN